MKKDEDDRFNYDHVWVQHGPRHKCCYVINNYTLCRGYEFLNPCSDDIVALSDKTLVFCKECVEAIKKIKEIPLEVKDA